MSNIIKEYYSLTKGRLVMGNLVAVLGGVALAIRGLRASGGAVPWHAAIAAVFGMALVMASGCVFNNCIDRDIDARMERTRHRALVERQVSLRAACIFGSALGALGFAILLAGTNLIAVACAFAGFFFYVIAYSAWAKRRGPYGTFVGSIAGAIPPVVGYVATSGRFDIAVAILIVIMVAWQMAHFFAIAIRRYDDYAAAEIPVMPVRYGIFRTKVSMLIYVIEFIIAASLLTWFGYEGYGYLAGVLALGLPWLGIAIAGFRLGDLGGAAATVAWARRMFACSLIVMVGLFAMLGISAIAW